MSKLLDAEQFETYSPAEERPLFGSIWSQKRLLFWVIAFCLVVSALYTLIVPPLWEAKAVLLFPTRLPSILGAAGFTEQGSLASSLVGAATPIKVYTGILDSERTMDFVAAGTGLDRQRIERMRDFQDEPAESTLTITARDRNAALAKKVVSLHVQALNQINKELNGPLFSDDTAILTREVAKQQGIVRRLERNLLDFESHSLSAPGVTASPAESRPISPLPSNQPLAQTNIVAGPGTWLQQQRQLEVQLQGVKAMLSSALQHTERFSHAPTNVDTDLPPARKWRDRLNELQYDLTLKELSFPPTSQEVQHAKEVIAVTRQQLQKEMSQYIQGVKSQALDPTAPESSVPVLLTQEVSIESQIDSLRRLAAKSPAESIEMTRRMRDLGTQSGILEQLETQLKFAQLQSERNPNRWDLLDWPRVEQKPVNKGYGRNAAIGLGVGLVFGSMLALWSDGRERSRVARSRAQSLR